MAKHAAATTKKGHFKRKRSPLAIGLTALVGLVLLVGIVILCWAISVSHRLRVDDDERQDLVTQLNAPSDGQEEGDSAAFYVLVVGSDARRNLEGARGDVMMLCRVDPDAGVVHLISIPRDTMVTLGGELEKINASFAHGGPAYAVDTVSRFAGVRISHYVEVDFQGLVDVVDLVGGVEVNVPAAFSVGGYSFPEGKQVLDGEQALAYARQRSAFTGGDFTRSQSQRQIAEGLIQKVLAASPTEIPGIISSIASMVSTDYRVPEIVSLALAFREKDVRYYSAVCPSYSLWQNGVSYVGTMYDEWVDLMKRVDAGLDPYDQDATIPEPQASSTELGSATNGAGPRDYRGLADGAGLTTDDVEIPH